MTRTDASISTQNSLTVNGTQRRGEFIAGARDVVPALLGYLAVGLAFGVVARSAGLSIAEVGLMSLILYAGSAQFVAAGLIAGLAPVAAIVVTVFLVNVRHLLYSAALAPYVHHLPLWKNALVGTELTDETFAVISSHLVRGRRASAAWLFGINNTAHVTWVAATVAGALMGTAIGDTQAWGLDFALPAMFAALLLLQITGRPALRVAIVVALIGAVVALLGTLAVAPSWAVIGATLIGATAGVLLEGKR